MLNYFVVKFGLAYIIDLILGDPRWLYHPVIIIGKLISFLEKILYISNNPDNFGIYEYDDIASGLNSVEIKKFHESMVVKILTDAANNFQHIFYEDEIET